MQQTLTAYLLPFALAIVWHGAISDAVGRRGFILCGQLLFLAGSLVCALAPSIDWLLVGRVLQGLSAGVGIVVGRSMLRDRFDGVLAQKQLALDRFPERRGLASSGYVTIQQASNALSAAVLVPLLLGSTLGLALGMGALVVLALLAFRLSQAGAQQAQSISKEQNA